MWNLRCIPPFVHEIVAYQVVVKLSHQRMVYNKVMVAVVVEFVLCIILADCSVWGKLEHDRSRASTKTTNIIHSIDASRTHGNRADSFTIHLNILFLIEKVHGPSSIGAK